jgi:hypothetical protein
LIEKSGSSYRNLVDLIFKLSAKKADLHSAEALQYLNDYKSDHIVLFGKIQHWLQADK